MSDNTAQAFEATCRNIQGLIQQGNLVNACQEAESLAKQDLSSEQSVQILYLLAVSYRLRKSFEEAIQTLVKIKQLKPTHARMYQELAYNYKALGDEKNAAKHFYLATKHNPALLSSWQALLPIYQQQQQAEASRLCQVQIDNLSALPQQVLAAHDLMHEGNLAAADQVVRGYLREHKHSLPALLLLAEIASKLKAISEAEFILETCVELANDDPEPKYQLFKIYSKLGKFKLALALSEKLVTLSPANLFYKVAHATALVGVGDINKAIELYDQIIAQDQAQSNVYLLLGHAHKTAGNIEKAVDAYRHAYINDATCGDAFWSLANTKTYAFTETDINLMQNGVESFEVSTDDKVHMHFALGKAFEDGKDFEKSFFHYSQGNQLKSELLKFSSAKHQAFVSHQIENFTQTYANKLVGKGHSDSAPIFIVGLPRAGSTLLEQILASHSQVDGTMELHEILGLAARLSKPHAKLPAYPTNLAELPSDLIAEFGKQFIDNTQVYRQSAPYFIDKMPNNFMHIGLIKTILPNAKIIDARRNPMACCFSGYKQLFGEGQEFTYSLSDIGIYYQQYLRLMAHWQTIYPNQILQVDHENIVNNTEDEIRRILDYCGLEFEQACLEFHKNKRAVKTPSAEQVRQPIYKDGLEQWKNYEAFLGELLEMFER